MSNTYAKLSAAAYNYNNRAQAESLAASTGYKVDWELSTPDAMVFYGDGKKPVIGYRGTVISNLDDLKADFSILMGNKNDKRFDDGVEIADRVKGKYNTDPYLTGHSLGGTVAAETSRKRGYRATVFNPGKSPFKRDSWPGVEVHRNTNDLISSGRWRDISNAGYVGIPLSYIAHRLKQFY